VFAICVTTTFAGSDCGRGHVYEHFGWPFSPEVEKQMNAILAQQNSQTNGVHRYDAAYFRLEE